MENDGSPKSSAASRESGIEILRILCIFMIVAHHLDYVGIDFPNLVNWRFLNLFGQVGVSGFILITGYFMVNKQVRLRKILSLTCEVWFYSIAISACMCLLGRSTVDTDFLWHTFFPLTAESWWFATFFIVLMLIIPALNKIANTLDGHSLALLLLVAFIVLVVAPCAADAYQFDNQFFMFLFLYLLGAYIRLNPSKYTETPKYSIVLLLVMFVGTYFAIDFTLKEFITLKECVDMLQWRYALFAVCVPVTLAILFLTRSLLITVTELSLFAIAGLALHQPEIGFTWVQYFYKYFSILTVMMALFLFLTFKNIKIGHVRPINWIASTTFAAYLISMHREFTDYLYHTLLDTTEYVGNPDFVYFMVGSLLLLLAACTAIDLCRQGFLKLLSKPIDRVYGALAGAIRSRFPSFEHYISL